MRTYATRVADRRQISPHLVRIRLAGGDLEHWNSTGIADEYVRLLIPPAGAELALPVIGEDFSYSFPAGAVEPDNRVYTIAAVHGDGSLDVEVVLHEGGIGSAWATEAPLGSEVGLTEPHGLYRPPAEAWHQFFVCDLTGVPALRRILRGLDDRHRVEAVVVVTDPSDVTDLPSAATVDIDWRCVPEERAIPGSLAEAVKGFDLPAEHRYVWLAGEARASREARKYLRRELGWPQSDFYTCGYWQIDAEKWNARYEAVAEEIQAEAAEAYEKLAGADEGAYLDKLDEIYERVGL